MDILVLIGNTVAGAVGALLMLFFTTKIKSKVQNQYDGKLEILKTELRGEVETKIELANLEAKAESNKNRIKWELKQKACLRALGLVDAVWSNIEWSGTDQQDRTIVATKQKLPDIVEARECYNHLCLCCDSEDVLRLFKICMRIVSGNSPLQADTIVDLRNAIRKELGFGNEVNFDRATAFIGTIPGSENDPSTQ